MRQHFGVDADDAEVIRRWWLAGSKRTMRQCVKATRIWSPMNLVLTSAAMTFRSAENR
jgi:hypothetical protein